MTNEKKASIVKWLIKNWPKVIAATISIFLAGIGTVGMYSFIMEETLQAQGFGYAILMMNKQWDDAYGAICEEEPHIFRNAMALRRFQRFNLLTGGAFRAYADATMRKLDRDKEFVRKMITEEKRERYLAKFDN